jgi:hypothetical protein
VTSSPSTSQPSPPLDFDSALTAPPAAPQPPPPSRPAPSARRPLGVSELALLELSAPFLPSLPALTSAWPCLPCLPLDLLSARLYNLVNEKFSPSPHSQLLPHAPPASQPCSLGAVGFRASVTPAFLRSQTQMECCSCESTSVRWYHPKTQKGIRSTSIRLLRGAEWSRWC